MPQYKVPDGTKRKVRGAYVPCPTIIGRRENLLIDGNQIPKSIFNQERTTERHALGIKEVIRKNFDKTLFYKIGETVVEDDATYTITPTVLPFTDVDSKRAQILTEIENELMDNYGARAIIRRDIFNEFSKTTNAQAMTDYLAALKTAWVNDIRPSINNAATYANLITAYKNWQSLLPDFPE